MQSGGKITKSKSKFTVKRVTVDGETSQTKPTSTESKSKAEKKGTKRKGSASIKQAKEKKRKLQQERASLDAKSRKIAFETSKTRIQSNLERVAVAINEKKYGVIGGDINVTEQCPKCLHKYKNADMINVWSSGDINDFEATCTVLECRHTWTPRYSFSIVVGSGTTILGDGIWYGPLQLKYKLREFWKKRCNVAKQALKYLRKESDDDPDEYKTESDSDSDSETREKKTKAKPESEDEDETIVIVKVKTADKIDAEHKTEDAKQAETGDDKTETETEVGNEKLFDNGADLDAHEGIISHLQVFSFPKLPKKPTKRQWKKLTWLNVLRFEPDLFFNCILHFGSFAAGMHWAFADEYAHEVELCPDFHSYRYYHPHSWWNAKLIHDWIHPFGMDGGERRLDYDSDDDL